MTARPGTKGRASMLREHGFPRMTSCAWVDETDFTREAAAQQVLRDVQSNGTRPLARAHQNGAFGVKHGD